MKKEALNQIDRILKVQPKNDKLLASKALILMDSGTEEEVLDYLSEALELVPNSSQLKKLEEKVRSGKLKYASENSNIPYERLNR